MVLPSSCLGLGTGASSSPSSSDAGLCCSLEPLHNPTQERLWKVKLKDRDQPDSTTTKQPRGDRHPLPGIFTSVATLPWPGDHQPPHPTPPTLLLFFLFSLLSFPFFAFLFARETQSRHDSVSPSLLISICTKSIALVWSHGAGLGSPSECASRLLSAWPLRPTPPRRPPAVQLWGCPGAAECGKPQPALAWSGSS